MEKQKVDTILPIEKKYGDKIELTKQLLAIYSVVVKHMTPRNIDLLTLCILNDANSDDFRDLVVDSDIGMRNHQQVNTELSRLRKQGFLYKDELYRKDHLSNGLKLIQKLVQGKNVRFILDFIKR